MDADWCGGQSHLRPYQADIIQQCRQRLLSGFSKICLVAPTGAGKTIIAAEIIRDAVANGERVLVMGHTREIIKQISTKLFAHDIVHGVIQAGFMTRPDASVQVASIQTLWVRAMRANRMELPSADLLIIDEGHHCPANTYRKIIDAYPQAVLMGLTATPCRGDGRGLGGIFDLIIECPQVADLIAEKYLVKSAYTRRRSRPTGHRNSCRRPYRDAARRAHGSRRLDRRYRLTLA